MKRIFLITLLFTISAFAYSSHTRGGWMYYEYLGPGAASNTLRYKITLKLYTGCSLGGSSTVNFSFFHGTFNYILYNIAVSAKDETTIRNCTVQACYPCITDIPAICYKITTYELVQDLPKVPEGYTVAYQRCCRVSNIINLERPSERMGETWTVKIPGTAIPGAETNSSARFHQNDTAIICRNSRFTFDFSATDIDNDSLVYSFTPAFNGAGVTDPVPDTASNPPYYSIYYWANFSGTSPMGPDVTIDSKTGIVSGIAYPVTGNYVMTVTVSEYKRGTTIKKSEVRKSLLIQVTDCTFAEADLKPEYLNCDGFTFEFSNRYNANVLTWDWDFGDGNTSTVDEPVHTYAAAGEYVLKLVVNRGLACSDSATSIVKVYPGFSPDFTYSGNCQNVPVQFTDLTTATYGVASSWNWQFGDFWSGYPTSTEKNPTYTYKTPGTYNIEFIVKTDKGCSDTVRKTITIYAQPALQSGPNDTLICAIDTLQLFASGDGSLLWSPNYNINDVTSSSPLVSPDVPTTYFVTVTNPAGCTNTDSIVVDVKTFVTLFGGNDTTICQTDSILLQLTSDALRYNWTPAAGLDDPTKKNPMATPMVTTTYHVVGNIGKCYAEDDITITTVPYPSANAGPDQTICVGASVQLNATGGSIYSWSPTAFLSNSRIPNPVVVNPPDNIRYVVTVRDVLGCPKPVNDTIIVNVAKIKAYAGPPDTSVVLGQPLQLNATGSVNYAWSPSTWLSSSVISNPVALPKNNIRYALRVSNDFGCFDTTSIYVNVFNVKPGLYTPNSFTPNNDGRNDVFRPIPIGMKSVDVFRVYNRWGQMLYQGSGNTAGWNGKFLNKPQEPATYVWIAEGTDYRNNKIKSRGSVVLIR